MTGSELDLQLEFYINGIAILAIASLGILGNVLSLMLFTFRSSTHQNDASLKDLVGPTLKIDFGPPVGIYGQGWSPQKARKSRQINDKSS